MRQGVKSDESSATPANRQQPWRSAACEIIYGLTTIRPAPREPSARMIYLVAILFPPLALLIYGKIFQAIFNLLIWLLALISIPIAIFPVFTLGLPMIIWGIAVVHAVLAVNSAKQDARAREVADAMRGRR